MHGKIDLTGDRLKRWPEHASILFIGSTGDGKSATINHLLNTNTVVAKTSSFEPGTRATVEYFVDVNNHSNEASNLKLSIIDTPGLNDSRGIEQDACNLHSIKEFFETHPQYSKYECYPNLIFLVISANEHRIDGSNSKLENTLQALNKLDVIDQNHPNVVAVLTFCCSVSHRNVSKWEKLMQEKKDIISHNIYQALGIHASVILLENDTDSHDLDEDGDFTLLPNSKRQPENVYKVCQRILEDNEDHCGLLNFNACLTQPNAKKQCRVADHKVLAEDCSKNSKSEVKQGLLNTLRGSTKGGKEVMINIEGGKKRGGSKTKSVFNGANRDLQLPSIKISVGVLLIWFCIIAWIAAVVLLKLTK